jgi:hypothetical protein
MSTTTKDNSDPSPHIIEDRLKLLGLALPAPFEEAPMKVKTPFSWVRLSGNRAYISRHGPQNVDGSIVGLLERSAPKYQKSKHTDPRA